MCPVRGDGLDAALGKELFKRQWLPAPSSTDSSDGLGPIFNARSCAQCHAGGGGARIVSGADGTRQLAGAVVRFGTSGGAPDPYYGLQLQTSAVNGLAAEGRAEFLPTLRFDLKGPPLAPGVHTGVRLAPSLIGRAVIDDIPDSEILAHADPDDRNGDGISGRVSRVGPEQRVGRFGWKAARVSLADQVAHAFMIDLGMSSAREPLPYGDCTEQETACRGAPTGESALTEGHEIPERVIDAVIRYLDSLTPGTETMEGRAFELFAKVGCAACHVPLLKDRSGIPRAVFSDLLLHDMGEALDDGVGEPGVASSEWRTAPLTGRNGRRGGRYLHDGSAATVAEAVAKHGGEARMARQAFLDLPEADRKQLAAYVEHLQ